MIGALSLIGDIVSPYALIYRAPRVIGTIIPDVTIEEVHRDELVITDHPVETGAAISDHAFKMPSEVEMKIGFSNSTAQTEGYVQLAYQELLALQKERQPFDVSTGKRNYTNMLIRSIEVVTDEKSEFALNVTVGLREVIIVNTQQGQTTQANQAEPQTTAPVQNGGVVQYTQPSGVGSTPPATISPGLGTG